MRNNSKLLALIILNALFVTTLIVGAVFLPHGIVAQRSQPLIKKIDRNQITKITIQSRDQNNVDSDITLIKSDTPSDALGVEQWLFLLENQTIASKSANVEVLLDTISSLQKIRAVSANAELFATLGIDAAQARVITLYDQNDIALHTLYFGNRDPQRGIYSRLNETDSVYLVKSDIGFYLEQGSGYWQRTALFPQELQGNDVVSLSVNAQIVLNSEEGAIDATYVLIRDTQANADAFDPWIVADTPEQALDQAKIENLVASLVNVQAEAFTALSAQASGISNVQNATIQFDMANGRSYALQVGPNVDQQSARFYAQAIGNGVQLNENSQPFVYTINDWALRPLLFAIEDLYPPPEEAQQ